MAITAAMPSLLGVRGSKARRFIGRFFLNQYLLTAHMEYADPTDTSVVYVANTSFGESNTDGLPAYQNVEQHGRRNPQSQVRDHAAGCGGGGDARGEIVVVCVPLQPRSQCAFNPTLLLACW